VRLASFPAHPTEFSHLLIDKFLRTHAMPALDPADRAAFEASAARILTFGARETIVREGVPLTQCTMLLDGWVHRYKDIEDGKRQILALHVPGDFVDLHSYPLKRLEHDVGALTDVRVAIFPHNAIRDLTARSPALTEVLWRSTLIDAAMNREWLVSVGARGALARIAHLFCELWLRLERVGAATDLTFTLPLTQADLGDAVGLTPVHVNRMLRVLRERGLAEFRGGRVTIRDWNGLQAVGEFDPSYLFLQ